MEKAYLQVQSDSALFENVKDLRREVFCGEELCEDCRDGDGIHIACAIGENVIGCGSAYDMGNGTFEISGIAVEKDYRGFNIGSDILKQLKELAKSQGANELVCESRTEYMGFFRKNGFPYENIAYKKNGKEYIKYRLNLVFDDAEWVEFDGNREAVIVRCDFDAVENLPAEIFVTGLGYCNVYIKGEHKRQGAFSRLDELYSHGYGKYVLSDFRQNDVQNSL